MQAAVAAEKMPAAALSEYNRILGLALAWNKDSPAWGFSYRCSDQASAMMMAITDAVWSQDHQSTQYWQVTVGYRQTFENEDLFLGLGSHAATMLVPARGNGFQYDVIIDGYKGGYPSNMNPGGSVNVQTPETFSQGYKYGNLPQRY
jgi:hypothetical protein